jgi:hypothetical protein
MDDMMTRWKFILRTTLDHRPISRARNAASGDRLLGKRPGIVSK